MYDNLSKKQIKFEEIKNIFKESDSKSILLSTEYVNNTTPIKILCGECGNIFEKTPKQIKRKNHIICNSCQKKKQGKNMRTKYEDVKALVESKNQELIMTKDEFENRSNSKTVKLKCENGHIYTQYISDIRKGILCKKCSNKRKSIKQKLPYLIVKKAVQDRGFELLSNEEEYLDLKKIKVRCSEGHESYVLYSNLVGKKSGCKYCKAIKLGKNKIKKYEYRKQFVEKYNCEILTTKDDYVDGNTVCELKCKEGHIFKTTMNKFKTSPYCPVCNGSLGEKRIMYFLDKNNVRYQFQHRFNDCRLKRPLPFDFYLPDYNMCIEFDGRQHFEVVNAFGGKEEFEKCKLRDEIKTNYCYENNICLLRIDYTKLNDIENILVKNLQYE